MRSPRETLFAVFIFCLAANDGAAQVNLSTLDDVLVKLHRSDWSRLDVKAASDKVSGKLINTWASGETCGSEVDTFMIGGDRNKTLRLRFEPVAKQAPASCRRYLSSVRYEIVFDSQAGAEAARMSFVASLRAGGLPEIDKSSQWQFRWRSFDSRTRFELSASVSEKRPYTATAFLQHADVQPQAVDYLPFEKGYMGCKCDDSTP